MEFWWIGYALAILAGFIIAGYGLWDRHKKDVAARDGTKITGGKVPWR